MFPRSPRSPAPTRVALVRVLTALEDRVAPAGLTHTTTTSTLVTEVVTNTPTTIELFDTRVVVPAGVAGEVDFPLFNRLISVAYDPTDPAIIAAIADAQALFPVGQSAIYLSSRTSTGSVASFFPGEDYDQTNRILTTSNTNPVETSRAEVVLSQETVETVGPATIRVGNNEAQTVFVPAGTRNTNTLTRISRHITTATTDTYTTTKFVVVSSPGGGSGGTGFTVSSRTIPVLVDSAMTTVNAIEATRVVGTFEGVRFDLTVNAAYDPANPDIRAAIASAQEAARSAGAKSAGRVIVGTPTSFRTETRVSTADQTSSVDVISVATNYLGPTAYYDTSFSGGVSGVAPGNASIDVPLTTTITTTRVRTTTDTFTTITTIQIIGDDGLRLRAVGADAGGGSRVRAATPDGAVALDVFVFEDAFTGGVRVATGDVTGDGVDDVLTAAGDGGGPRVRILDGATGATVRDMFAFSDTLRVGAFVAAADVNGDGFADYAVTAGLGGGSRVALFDGKTGERLVADFLAFDADSRTGFTVALGDVTGDGVPEITVGQLGGGSEVRVFDLTGTLASAFAAYESFAGGVYLSVGDADGNGTSEVITGAGPGGGPRVRAFGVTTGQPPTEVRNGFTFDAETRNGVRVGTGTNATAEALLVAGLSGVTRTAVAGQLSAGDEFAPFGPTWLGGVWLS